MHDVALCYHYVRPPKEADPFPAIHACRDFNAHVTALYHEDVLFTFDDGLADHAPAALMLADCHQKAAFFIPTCIFKGEPATPTVLHYAVAIHGVDAVVNEFNRASYDLHRMKTEVGSMASVKTAIKYRLPITAARRIVLEMFRRLVRPHVSLSDMHLTDSQLVYIRTLGHLVGAHTHTHTVVSRLSFSERHEWYREIVQPALMLACDTMSYPYGREMDCPARLPGLQLFPYRTAYTAEAYASTDRTHPLYRGRYMPRSTDSAQEVLAVVQNMRKGLNGETGCVYQQFATARIRGQQACATP